MGKLFCVTIINGSDMKILKLVSIFHMPQDYITAAGDKERFGAKAFNRRRLFG